MSRENVDRFLEVTEAFDRFGADPANSSAALRRLLAPMDSRIEFEPQQTALEGTYVGHDGIRQWLADPAEHYQEGHFDCTEVRDLEDRVLALGSLGFTGRGSGIKTEVPVAIVASFQGGLMTDFKDYGDRRQALEAVGLRD